MVRVGLEWLGWFRVVRLVRVGKVSLRWLRVVKVVRVGLDRLKLVLGDEVGLGWFGSVRVSLG